MSGTTPTMPIGEFAQSVAAILAGSDTSPFLVAALNGADFPDKAAVRSALSMGTAATRNVGTTAGTVADGAALASEIATRVATDAAISAIANAAMPKARIHRENPLDYGAVGNGTANDGAAVQAAINALPVTGGQLYLPRGYSFAVSRTSITRTNVEVTGGGRLVAMPIINWAPATEYHAFKNLNWSASVKTDSDMVWRDITLDWSAIASGENHIIYPRMATRIIVEDCTLIGLGSQTAFLACDDTWVVGNRFLNFRNCGADHWEGCNNNRVINNYFYTPLSAQMVNWNPDPTTGANSNGYSCTGFVMTGNVLISDEDAATPCQIEPLRSGAYAAGITITGNKLTNCHLVLRGDVRNAIVANNEISNTLGEAEPITHYGVFGQRASGIVIAGNIIRGANTAAPNLGVIRCETTDATISGNHIIGNAYSTSPIYIGTYKPQLYGNDSAASQPLGRMRAGFALDNGGTLGWRDSVGGLVRWVLQTDENLLLLGTSADGSQRPIMSMFQRSDMSSLFLLPPLVFGEPVTETPVRMAASGTSIGTATSSPANWVEITSATVGENDAFVLTSTVGRRQSITNSTGIAIKVFPRNSGAGRINGGSISAAVTIPDGATWQFMHFNADNYRVVAKT